MSQNIWSPLKKKTTAKLGLNAVKDVDKQRVWIIVELIRVVHGPTNLLNYFIYWKLH